MTALYSINSIIIYSAILLDGHSLSLHLFLLWTSGMTWAELENLLASPLTLYLVLSLFLCIILYFYERGNTHTHIYIKFLERYTQMLWGLWYSFNELPFYFMLTRIRITVFATQNPKWYTRVPILASTVFSWVSSLSSHFLVEL